MITVELVKRQHYLGKREEVWNLVVGGTIIASLYRLPIKSRASPFLTLRGLDESPPEVIFRMPVEVR